MNCLLSYDFWDRVVDSVRDWYDPNSAYRNLPDDVCLFYLFRYIYIQYENVTFHLGWEFIKEKKKVSKQ